ncbi:EAL domain-containing protein [Bacillus sp. T3]|uniref:sensor domain-containing protein n=1 Tax=Bacillus sp. T3 TaxID=467262 RepID=UPI002981AE4C|nr:EAL domain-containing protein [Bacillus sp. T3]
MEKFQHISQYNIFKEKLNVIHSNKYENLLIQNNKDIIAIIDPNGQIKYINPTIERVLGYRASESIGTMLVKYINFEHLYIFQNLINEIMKNPNISVRTELRLKHKNNSYIWCEVQGTNYFSDHQINGIVIYVRDISEQVRLAGVSNQNTYFDYLTGLPDRRSFENKLNQEIEKASNNKSIFALLLLDLDEFKHLNDSQGHHMGDQLLKDVSVRIKAAYDEDVFLGRLGGDEFVFLLKDIKKFAEIHKNAKKLVNLINNTPFKINDNEFFLSVSIGVSTYPHSGINLSVLLKNAEMAMYHAKNKGKNQYQFFSPTMDVNSNKQFTLRNDMNRAINNEEFVIYYQPRFDPITNKTTGAEALIRWQHPKWGMIPPNQFIPLAEETGLINPIGEWLIRRVCNQIKAWERENITPLKTSINLSSLQLQKPNFVELVSSILVEVGLDPKFLEFEITESVIINREEQVLKTLTEINNIGITIALDDFGTGYSALSYLRKFPCKTIKLDKSLIDGIHNVVENYQIAAAIINLCQRLKKSVVAEGVETKEQLDILRQLSCNEIQGYIYSKPLDEYEYERNLYNGEWFKSET